jgi:hypothetical protein
MRKATAQTSGRRTAAVERREGEVYCVRESGSLGNSARVTRVRAEARELHHRLINTRPHFHSNRKFLHETSDWRNSTTMSNSDGAFYLRY